MFCTARLLPVMIIPLFLSWYIIPPCMDPAISHSYCKCSFNVYLRYDTRLWTGLGDSPGLWGETQISLIWTPCKKRNSSINRLSIPKPYHHSPIYSVLTAYLEISGNIGIYISNLHNSIPEEIFLEGFPKPYKYRCIRFLPYISHNRITLKGESVVNLYG